MSRKFSRTQNTAYENFDVGEEDETLEVTEVSKRTLLKRVLLIGLAALLLIIIVLVALLIPVIAAKDASFDTSRSVITLSNLCANQQHVWAFSGVVINPASVAVELTAFSLDVRFQDALMGSFVGNAQPINVLPGENVLDVSSTFSIASTDVTASLLNAFLNRTQGVPLDVLLDVSVSVRVYGGLSLTIPFSVTLDLNKSNNNTGAGGSPFSLSSVSLQQNTNDLFSLLMGAQLSGSDFFAVDLPALSISVTNEASERIAVATTSPFLYGGNSTGDLLAQISVLRAHLTTAKNSVSRYSSKLDVPLAVSGNADTPSTCVAQNVLNKVQLRSSIEPSQSSASLVTIEEIFVDSDAAQTDHDLPVEMLVTLNNTTPLVGAIPAVQFMLDSSQSLSAALSNFTLHGGENQLVIPVNMSIRDFTSAGQLVQKVLDGDTSAALQIVGFADADMLSALLSAYVIDIPLLSSSSSTASSDASFIIERARISDASGTDRAEFELTFSTSFSPRISGNLLPTRLAFNEGISLIDFDIPGIPRGSSAGQVRFNVTVTDFPATASFLDEILLGNNSFPKLELRGQVQPLRAHAIGKLVEQITVRSQPSQGSSGGFSVPQVAIDSVGTTSVDLAVHFNTSIDIEGNFPPVTLVVAPDISEVDLNFDLLSMGELQAQLRFPNAVGTGAFLTDVLAGIASNVTVSGSSARTDVISRILALVSVKFPVGGSTGQSSKVGLRKVVMHDVTSTLVDLSVILRNDLDTKFTGTIPTQSFIISETTPATRNILGATSTISLLADPIVRLGLAVPVVVDTAAALQDILNDGDPVFEARGVAASDVISQVLANTLITFNTSSKTSSSSDSSLLSAISVAGAPSPNEVYFDVMLDLEDVVLEGNFPLLDVQLSFPLHGGVVARLELGPTQFTATGGSFPPLHTKLVLAMPDKLADIADAFARSAPVQIVIAGSVVSNANIIQQVLQAMSHSVDFSVPSSETVAGGSLPETQIVLQSSTSSTLTLGVTLSFDNPGSFVFNFGSAALSAVFNDETIISALIASQPLPNAVSPGSNTIDATVTIQGGSALELWASEYFRTMSTPLTLTGAVSDPGTQFRPAAGPVNFSWDFTLPSNASGNSTDMIPCFEIGLTTPFVEDSEAGNKIFGGRCESGALCAVGKNSPHCDTAALLSRCVSMALKIIGHLHIHNPLDVDMQINKVDLDGYFDFRVASMSYDNLQNVENVHFVSLRESSVTSNNLILNAFPIVIGAHDTDVLSFYLTEADMIPNPLTVWKPGTDQGLPGSSNEGTAILMEQAYAHADSVPLSLDLRNVALELQIQNFIFTFRFNFTYDYAKEKGLPSFLTDASVMCSFKDGLRSPCWKLDKTRVPNCYLSHFEYPCINAGSPSSYCAAIFRPFWDALLNNQLGDICCRDFEADGIVPYIRPFCFATEVEGTGTYLENMGSCPANARNTFIESGYKHQVL